jgi:F0F1-type ATP synthase membrane subunit b/b'
MTPSDKATIQDLQKAEEALAKARAKLQEVTAKAKADIKSAKKRLREASIAAGQAIKQEITNSRILIKTVAKHSQTNQSNLQGHLNGNYVMRHTMAVKYLRVLGVKA